jgi:hypothetical protein
MEMAALRVIRGLIVENQETEIINVVVVALP